MLERLKYSNKKLRVDQPFFGRMPIPKPVKNRERCSTAMTIAFGALAHDGFLVAADTEVNDGVTKTKQSKIFAATKRFKAWKSDASLVVTGAGDLEYLRILTEKISETFYTIKEPDMSFSVLETCIGSIVHSFFQDHVYPITGQGMPDVSLIVGCSLPAGEVDGQMMFQSMLWRSSRSAFSRPFNEVAVTGIGTSELRNQIAQVWTQRDDMMKIENLVPLVVYVLRRVKDAVPACGNDTYICCNHNGKNRVVNFQYIRELESYFIANGPDLERCAASFVFGDKEPITKVTSALKKAKSAVDRLQGKMWTT